jgi:hypothetical protein
LIAKHPGPDDRWLGLYELHARLNGTLRDAERYGARGQPQQADQPDVLVNPAVWSRLGVRG